MPDTTKESEYDPTRYLWHMTWMQPAGGEFVNQIECEVGGRIVQEGG